MTTRDVTIEGMKLGGALNARVHWTSRASKVRRERLAVRAALAHGWQPDVETAGPPTTCTMVRYAPRMLDDDNLQGAFKAIRDEVAAFFGVDDGPRGPIAWRYLQRKGEPKQYAVCIRLTWGEA
mgnify:FL=1